MGKKERQRRAALTVDGMAIGMAWQQQEERLVEGGRAKGQPAEEGRQREEGTWHLGSILSRGPGLLHAL